MKLLIKRTVIILSTLTIMVVLSITSEDNLFANLPSESDVLQSIIEKQEIEAKILKDIRKQEKEAEEALEKALEQEKEKIYESLLDSIERDDSNDFDDLFNHSIRHTFIVEFTRSEFDGLVNDMIAYDEEFGGYGWTKDYRSNNYRSVSVTYIDDNKILEFEEVGIRSKGNIYSRRLPIDSNGNVIDTHYVLKFNETFDYPKDSEEYEALKKREAFDLEKLIFKYNNTSDPAVSNEVYSTHLFQQMDIIMPHASYAELVIVIDGKVENRSLYNIFEYADEEFVRRAFNGSTDIKETGNLYKMTWGATLSPDYDSWDVGIRDWRTAYRPMYGRETNDEIIDYSDLKNFTLALDNDNDIERKAWLESSFDVDSFLKAMAVNVLLGNPDDYRGNMNNYYFYFDTDGYATYIPFDYDNSLGSGWPGATFTRYTLDDHIYTWGNTEGQRPLVDQIFDYEEYRIQYENYMEELIMTGKFSYGAYSAFVAVPESLYPEFLVVNNKDYYFLEKINDTLTQIAVERDERE